jgi:hypothetical protein
LKVLNFLSADLGSFLLWIQDLGWKNLNLVFDVNIRDPRGVLCKREWIRKVVEGRREKNRLGYSVKLAVLTTKTYWYRTQRSETEENKLIYCKTRFGLNILQMGIFNTVDALK